MARIKAEVREHAHQQRRARQHHPPTAAPTCAPPPPETAPVVVKTEVEMSPAPPPPPLPPPRDPPGARWIDLTADEETEDEEDADEPFAAAIQRIREQEPDHCEEHEQGRREQEQEPEQDQGEASPMELETDAEDEEVSKATARPAVASNADATDESEIDEEMPAAPVLGQESEDARAASQDTSPRGGVGGGVRAVVDKISHALSAAMPSFSRSGASAASAVGEEEKMVETTGTQAARGDAGRGGGEDADNDEEEEDERWPELQPRNIEQDDDVGDEDGMDSTGSETGDGSVENSRATMGESLEDGEIFEEGAVGKTPAAVKVAIALELHAARAAANAANAAMARKKQKKRGRKKNKRKADAMLAAAPVNEVDEFGRNVRHQPTMPRSVSLVQSSHVQEFLPSMAMPVSTQIPVQAPPPLLPLPPLMATPPRPPLLPHPPPLPMHDYGNLHAPQHFVDDHIVRVNRHGAFEPFALHANRGPRPPIAPPFSQPPPPPSTGFRYVSMEHFGFGNSDIEEGTSSRGFERPPPPSKPPVDVEPVFDLDSLRAAALKTKRKSTNENNTAASTDPPVQVASATNQSEAASADAASTAEEGERNLDTLRMELLQSMRRKRREPSGQSVASATDSVDDSTSREASGISREGSEPSPPKALAEAAQAAPLSIEAPKQPLAIQNFVPVFGLPVPESPQIQPLGASSKSLVIHLSMAELAADSFDDAAAHYQMVVQDVQAQAVSTKVSRETQSTSPPSAVTTIQDEQPVFTVDTETSATPTADATTADAAEPAAQASTTRATAQENGVHKEQVDWVATTKSVLIDPEILADPAKLEVERQACLANIREADANIARLDAEIAALRLVIAAREAETPKESQSSATACGA